MGKEKFEKNKNPSDIEGKGDSSYEEKAKKAHKKEMEEVEKHGGYSMDEVLDIEGIEKLGKSDEALSIPPEIERVIKSKAEGLNRSQLELLKIAASLLNRYVQEYNKYVMKKPENVEDNRELLEELLESISLKYDDLNLLKRSDDEFGAAFEMIKELREYVESELQSEEGGRMDIVLNNIGRRVEDFNYDIFLDRAEDEHEKDEARRSWRYVMDTIAEKKLKKSE